MSKVYIVQDKIGANFQSARKFGELIFMLPPGTLYCDTRPTVETLKNKLADFTSDDYLILTGDPHAMCLAFFFAVFSSGGKINVLKWDRQTQSYYLVTENFHDHIS